MTSQGQTLENAPEFLYMPEMGPATAFHNEPIVLQKVLRTGTHNDGRAQVQIQGPGNPTTRYVQDTWLFSVEQAHQVFKDHPAVTAPVEIGAGAEALDVIVKNTNESNNHHNIAAKALFGAAEKRTAARISDEELARDMAAAMDRFESKRVDVARASLVAQAALDALLSECDEIMHMPEVDRISSDLENERSAIKKDANRLTMAMTTRSELAASEALEETMRVRRLAELEAETPRSEIDLYSGWSGDYDEDSTENKIYRITTARENKAKLTDILAVMETNLSVEDLPPEAIAKWLYYISD